MFTDGELPTFTEGREKRNIIAPTFTDGELPRFNEGSKKITSFPKILAFHLERVSTSS